MSFLTGLVAVLFVCASFQKNNRNYTLALQSLAALFFCLHFAIIEAWTASVMSGISILRAYVFYIRDRHPWLNHLPVPISFSLTSIGFTALTWDGLVSLLAGLGMVTDTFALWSKSTRQLRLLSLLSRPFWITHHLLVGSFMGLLAETFILASLALAFVRFRKTP
jgi:hypothetical protein